jgi:hypothetical protein
MNLVYISFKVLSETHCLEDLNAEN